MAEQKPVAWAVSYDGKSPEHDFIAGDCGERVKAMAKGIGGTAQAIPLYAHTSEEFLDAAACLDVAK